MLDTLKKIGDQLLEGKGIWARLVTEPKHNPDKKNWVCPILFDCIDQEIRFLKDKMTLYHKEDSIYKFKYIDTETWGRRGKKCALTVEPKNFQMLEETLFGKKGGDSGSMMNSILDFDPELENKPIYTALEFINAALSQQRSKLDLKSFKEELDLGSKEDVVLFYSLIRSENFNSGKPISLFDLEGHKEFIVGKFATPKNVKKGIDHITGDVSDEVIEAVFSGRKSIHKTFQTTYLNHASNFSDFSRNYQSNPSTLASLDKASDYIFENLSTHIAGVNHIILPNYLHKDLKNFDLGQVKSFLKTTDELLFQYQSLDTELDKHLPDLDVFWVNYIAYETDGNYFKIMNHIKDVNSFYLKRMIEVCGKTAYEIRRLTGWRSGFNFRTIYSVVPVREKSSKNNSALILFKQILEQEAVSPEILYKHFVKFIVCHRNKQFDKTGKHRSFPNIREKETFEYAARDGVNSYLALLKILEHLNLITMTAFDSDQAIEKIREKYPNNDVNEFLDLKKSTRNQIALFCLGRALNAIGYAQEMKKHKTRPILKKVNFNGMPLNDVKNLYKALMEKGTQYQTVPTKKGETFHVRKNVENWLDLFSKYVDELNWNIKDEEATFYLLSGYVFRPSTQNNEENDAEETE